MILRYRVIRSGEPTVHFGVSHEVAAIQAAEVVQSADPEAAVAGCQEVQNHRVGQFLSRGRLPADEAHPVESHQAGAGSQPEIAVRGLRESIDCGKRISFFLCPTDVQVLRRGKTRIESSE